VTYKFIENQSFAHYASGRVIVHRTGYPNFPVRLAGEIYLTCLEMTGKSNAVLYDPCCGGAYLLTALGFLCGEQISAIYASDIAEEAVTLAQENLRLLTAQGLAQRQTQLERIHGEFGKQSHADALQSVEYFKEKLQAIPMDCTVFSADIMNATALNAANFKADIVFADVPYGNLAAWSQGSAFAVDKLLDSIIPVLSDNAIVAICSDKRQKITNPSYRRLRKQLIGKRKIELLRKED